MDFKILFTSLNKEGFSQENNDVGVASAQE
jgi:hypothetical protein